VHVWNATNGQVLATIPAKDEFPAGADAAAR